MNRDGRVDLMTKNYGGMPPSWVRGFPAQRIHIAGGAPLEFATSVEIMLSRGDGTFEAREPFLMPSHPQWGRYGHRVLMGDLNRDGHRDAVIRTTHDLVVLMSKGGGDFEVHSRFLPMEPFGTWETDLGDVDRDGNLDVISAGARSVRVLFGDGRGGFHRIASIYLP